MSSEETLWQSPDEQETASLRSGGGPKISGYQLQEVLGTGSFGTVFAGIQQRTGQPVAVKVLRRENLHWEQFKHELSKLTQIAEHPHIVTLLDADLEHNPPYFVMPLLAEGSLENLEPAQQRIEQIVAWLEQMARALTFMHRKGIFHCDLKPSNVLLDAEGKIRVVDFGQACHDGAETGSFGTLGYMPPEQAFSSARPEVSWDIYGFGATAYRLLTGHCPRFSSQDRSSLTHTTELGERLQLYRQMVQQRPLEPIVKANPKVDADLAAIVENCLQIDPQKRTATLQQVLEDFRRRRSREPLLCRRPWSLRYQVVRFLSNPTVGISLLVAISLPLFVNTYLTLKAYRNIRQLVQHEARQVNLSCVHHWNQLPTASRTLEHLYRGEGYEHLWVDLKEWQLSPRWSKMQDQAGPLPSAIYKLDQQRFVGAWTRSGRGILISQRSAESALAPADEMISKNAWLNGLILFVAGLSAMIIVRFSQRKESV